MNILITAGGTIEPIDNVRTINNMSTGKLGSVICDTLTKFSINDTTHSIDRLLSIDEDHIFYIHSSTAIKPISNDLVTFIEIKDTSSLEKAVKELFNSHKIDVVVHSMAVSDYTVNKILTEDMLQNSDSVGIKENKISSENEKIYLELVKTPKIINLFKQLNPEVFLIGFKLLSDVSDDQLLEASYKQIDNSGSDIVVANDLKDIKSGNHRAIFVTEANKGFFKYTCSGKEEIAESIKNQISDLKNKYISVTPIFCNDWYDGPLTGLCKYNGEVYYFKWTDSCLVSYERIYSVYKLNEWQTAVELQIKENFEKYVSFMYSYDISDSEISEKEKEYQKYKDEFKENNLDFWSAGFYQQLKKEQNLYINDLEVIGLSKSI